MSRLNRKQLRNVLLKEFKMIGMASPSIGMLGSSPYGCDACGQSPCACDDDGACDACGCSPCQCDEYEDDHDHGQFSMTVGKSDYVGGHKGQVSKEDCCAAIMCMIECCECPETRQKLRETCESILSGRINESKKSGCGCSGKKSIRESNVISRKERRLLREFGIPGPCDLVDDYLVGPGIDGVIDYIATYVSGKVPVGQSVAKDVVKKSLNTKKDDLKSCIVGLIPGCGQ